MKKIIKCFAVAAMALAAVAACTEENPVEDNKNGTENNGGENNGGENNGGETQKPELKEESLTAVPTGDTLTFSIEATADWTIYTDDECEWITVDPESGNGNADVNFYVTANESGRDRSVSFFVKEGEWDIYEIFISQVKMELPILEGDMDFIKQIVDQKLYGDDTPVVENWYSFLPEGFDGINFGMTSAGKLYVESIYIMVANADVAAGMNHLVSLPKRIHLENLTDLYINYRDTPDACELNGSFLPTDWNTPKLQRIHLETVGITGHVSDSLAMIPDLRNIFLRACDIYGALPHEWASENMESLVMGYNSADDCPGLGYLVPAAFDVVLNSDPDRINLNRDKTEYKLGGSTNWKGFEEGWGQLRYELFDPAAEAGNVSVWSNYRGFTEDDTSTTEDDEARNMNADSDWYKNTWPWFFYRIGHVPAEMKAWDQAEADAYTQACKDARGH